MTQDYKALLKMIEEVDPNDTDKITDINIKVEEFLKKEPIVLNDSRSAFWGNVPWLVGEGWVELPDYTNSRDALKYIRPEVTDWYLYKRRGKYLFGFSFNNFGTNKIESPIMIKEELAELHAIIQVIAYERGLE